MEPLHIGWSACTADFRGAGLYLGIATRSEIEGVQHGLTLKQVRVYTGETVRLHETRLSPITYFAVRDPSAVKVKPVDRPALENGFRHVKLVFNFDRLPPAEVRAAALPPETCEEDPAADQAAGLPTFLMTVGLAPGKEESFFQRAVCDHPEQSWGELFPETVGNSSREQLVTLPGKSSSQRVPPNGCPQTGSLKYVPQTVPSEGFYSSRLRG